MWVAGYVCWYFLFSLWRQRVGAGPFFLNVAERGFGGLVSGTCTIFCGVRCGAAHFLSSPTWVNPPPLPRHPSCLACDNPFFGRRLPQGRESARIFLFFLLCRWSLALSTMPAEQNVRQSVLGLSKKRSPKGLMSANH